MKLHQFTINFSRSGSHGLCILTMIDNVETLVLKCFSGIPSVHIKNVLLGLRDFCVLRVISDI